MSLERSLRIARAVVIVSRAHQSSDKLHNEASEARGWRCCGRASPSCLAWPWLQAARTTGESQNVCIHAGAWVNARACSAAAPPPAFRRLLHRPSSSFTLLLTGASMHPFLPGCSYADLVASALAACRQLEGSSQQLAASAAGPATAAEPGPRVALFCDPGADYVAGAFGTWMHAGISVPLCLSHPDRELQYALEDAEVSSVLVSEPHAERLLRLAQVGAARWLMCMCLMQHARPPALHQPCLPSSPCITLTASLPSQSSAAFRGAGARGRGAGQRFAARSTQPFA